MNRSINKPLRFLKRNSSTILTVVGSAGVVATTVLAVKATPKAMRLIEEAKVQKGEDLTKMEIVKVAAPAYIPTAVTGVSSLACIIGANVMSKRAQASMMSAYMLIDKSYKQYKDKLKELYGQEAHEKIIDAITLEKAEDIRITAHNFAECCDLTTEYNDGQPVLFFDEFGNRYFETTIEKVITAEYHLNRNFTLRGYVTLNEFYSFLGLKETEYGDTVGWAIDDDEMYWIDFNHRKVTMDDGLECYIIETPWGPSEEHMDDYWA